MDDEPRLRCANLRVTGRNLHLRRDHRCEEQLTRSVQGEHRGVWRLFRAGRMGSEGEIQCGGVVVLSAAIELHRAVAKRRTVVRVVRPAPRVFAVGVPPR